MRLLLSFLILSTVAACIDRNATHVIEEAAGVGDTRGIYVATNRKLNDNGRLKGDRGKKLLFEEVLVSIPPSHKTGELTANQVDPVAAESFVFAKRRPIDDEAQFLADIQRDLRVLPKADRQLTLFVHGYNNSYPESIFRAAQLSHDLIIPGITLAFSWPSRARFLNYLYDHDSALYSRDELVDVLKIMANSGATRINLVGHSMGAFLLMEALQQIEHREPGFTAKRLGGVFLISPDIDLGVFKKQIAHFDPLPVPFGIVVSRKDAALRVSEVINGPSRRLGRHLNPEGLDQYSLAILDVSNFATGRDGNHFTFGNSSNLISIFQRREAVESILFPRDAPELSGPQEYEVLGATVVQTQRARLLTFSVQPNDGR